MTEETHSHTIEATDDTFEDEVIKSDLPTVVDVWAVWCGPCRVLSPILDELAEEYKGKIKVVKVDADKNQQITSKYSVQSIPTVMYFKDGKLTDTTIGSWPKPKLKEHFDKLLS